MDNKKDLESLAAQYRNKLTSPVASLNESLENLPAAATLSKDNISDRLSASRQELYRIIDNYLDGKKELYDVADKIAKSGKDVLSAVRDNDNDFLNNNPDSKGLLEIIVRTDGSRPSFLIKNDEVDRKSSPIGTWDGILDVNADILKKAISYVGRINLSGVHVGTGFQLRDNLIVTNRHVMQAIATKNNDGKWILKPGAAIDFGYEFRGRASVNPLALKQIVFCGKDDIDRAHIDHGKLDLAIIELETAPGVVSEPKFSIDTSSEWAASDAYIYTIGYPANPQLPGIIEYGNLLDVLFHSTYGYKRLAPGQVFAAAQNPANWTMAHDATTLGGNSGSAIIRVGREYASVALHYGGSTAPPRQNWGHVLGNALIAPNLFDSRTLKDVLESYKVKIIDN
jgi:hypothetical protein